MNFSKTLVGILFLITTFNLSSVFAESRRVTRPGTPMMEETTESATPSFNQDDLSTAAIDDEMSTTALNKSRCGVMNAKACRAFYQVNKLRRQQGLRALSPHSTCTRAAQYHARNMAKNGFFAHDAPGESWRQRMSRYRLDRNAVAENIAMTSSGPASAVNLWVNSSGHYRNMMNGQFRSGGMGHANGYYVHCFTAASGK